MRKILPMKCNVYERLLGVEFSYLKRSMTLFVGAIATQNAVSS